MGRFMRTGKKIGHGISVLDDFPPVTSHVREDERKLRMSASAGCDAHVIKDVRNRGRDSRLYPRRRRDGSTMRKRVFSAPGI